MPDPKPEPSAIERVKDIADWFADGEFGHVVAGSVCREHAEDLRTLLSALQKANAALEEATATLRLVRVDAAYHLQKYRPHVLNAVNLALSLQNGESSK